MITTGYNGYKNTIVNTTCSKDKILLLLYEKALLCLKMARKGIEEENPRIKGENISRILAILTEFECALDKENGGNIADSLGGLYSYCTDRLTAANIHNDSGAVQEVEEILAELYEGFKDAALQAAGNTALHAKPATDMAGGGMRIAV
jgi:flagellar protein FliS